MFSFYSGTGESPLLGLAKKQSLHSSFCFPQDLFPQEINPQTYCLLHLKHLLTYYSLFCLLNLFVTGSKDSVEKAELLLWIFPNFSLWNQDSFAQICITPGFTSSMSESFPGYENPFFKKNKQKSREKERKKESSLSSRNYPSKTG